MKRLTSMTFGTTINLFVEGVKPMWEEENCSNGGKWSIRLPKTHTNKLWEDLILALIGDQFTDAGEVLGLVIVLRHQADTI